VAYFENRGARPIQRGENPANWVLTAMTSGDRDFAKDFLESDEYTRTQGRLVEIQANRSPEKEISYDEVFACPKKQRSHLMSTRLMTIYWRSPSYNCKNNLSSAHTCHIGASRQCILTLFYALIGVVR